MDRASGFKLVPLPNELGRTEERWFECILRQWLRMYEELNTARNRLRRKQIHRGLEAGHERAIIIKSVINKRTEEF